MSYDSYLLPHAHVMIVHILISVMTYIASSCQPDLTVRVHGSTLALIQLVSEPLETFVHPIASCSNGPKDVPLTIAQ